MPSGINVPLTFQIFNGDTLVRTETLTQDIIKIGKLSSSHLRIDDESVSRMHAVIEIAGPEEIYIIDLGSTKGTLVNGQKVNKCKVQSGDQIILGSTRLVVMVGEPVAAAGDDGPTQVQLQPTGPSAKQTQMGMPAVQAPAAFPPPPVAQAPTMQAQVPNPFPPPPVATPQASFPPPPVGQGFPPPPIGAQGFPPPPVGGQQFGQPQQPQYQQPAQQQYQQQQQYAAPRAPSPNPMGNVGGFGPPPGFDPGAVEVQDGSRAIEVAAMFEDSVVDVRHFSNPAAGEVTGMTKGLLGGGAAALVVAFISFVVAYVQAAHLQAAWDAWDNSGHPHNDFIVPRSGPGLDILVSLGLVIGIYCIVYGLLRLFGERQPRHFTIGPESGTLFPAPGDQLPVGTFPLVHSTGTDYELLFTNTMQGDVTLGDGAGAQSISLAQLAQSGRAHASGEVPGAYAWSIPAGARAKIDLGQNTFLVSSVPPPRHYPTPFAIDWSQQSYTAITGLVVALFLGMIYSIPPDPKSLSLDAFMNDQRFAKFLIKPPEEKEEQIPDWLKKKGPDEAGGKGKRHKGEEGKMGKKTSKNKTGLYGLKGPKDNPDPHMAKMLAEENAQKAGVLGILKAQDGSQIASIFGRDSALGNDAENVLGGLVGTQIGEAYGVGGLGLVGSGKGGGGTGEGTIGLGNLGTIGKGGGGGNGSGYGRGAGGLGGRRSHAPDVVPGTAQVRGSLDKEIIRRVIRRHLNEVRFCYEKELLRNPNLYGRVMIEFTIAGTGSVVASVVQNSTMGNSQVEQCIAGAVRRWEFPKPQGGGIVMVSYPFVLKAAGGE